MTDWLERARREIQNSLSQTAAKTAKTGVSAATAAPHLEESGISGVGFVGFGNTLAEGFPENDGDFHPHREIQETSSQTAAKTAKTPLPPERRPVDTRHLLPSAALAEIPPDDPAQRRIKVSILGKNGLMVTIVTQSAWTLHEWKQFAWRPR